MRWRVVSLVVVVAIGAAVAIAKPASNPLARAMTELAHGNGVAAEQDIWTARRQGASLAATHHLMAHAFLQQGDAIRALAEADPAQIPPAFADEAARIRIKAYLLIGNLAATRNELDQALARMPNDDSLWADEARLRAQEDDLAGAIIAGHRAVALNPRGVDALLLSASL